MKVEVSLFSPHRGKLHRVESAVGPKQTIGVVDKPRSARLNLDFVPISDFLSFKIFHLLLGLACGFLPARNPGLEEIFRIEIADIIQAVIDANWGGLELRQMLLDGIGYWI